MASHAGPLIIVMLAMIWGTYRLKRHPVIPEHGLRVAILQGNIDQYQKWDAAHESFIKTRYGELVLEAAKQNPDVIIWPESAVPGWIPNDQAVMEWLVGLIQQSRCYHVVGAVSRRGNREYNSAFFFSPKGDILDVYDKQHLVPFGEYIPFGNIFKRWIPYLGELGTFDAGVQSKLFVLPSSKLAPNICYEAVFPGLVRKGVKSGADVIVNLTNDGWYLKTGAPAQHYAVNVYRALENKVPVVRAANTGISAIIDAYGRPISKSQLMEKDCLVGYVPRS
jgi:apolipoprotein N-acyltransferase